MSNVSAYAHLSGPFEYNKMPLAPMGISVQVHEKTDKIVTWEYHTVNGWYLATSPEHYQTHRYHIKYTNNERFTDTIHYNHKDITRPTITHSDKVMAEIKDFSKSIKNLVNNNGADEIQQIINITERALQQKTSTATTPKTTTGASASSRVPLYTNNNTRQKISMTHPHTQVPQLSTSSVTRVEH